VQGGESRDRKGTDGVGGRDVWHGSWGTRQPSWDSEGGRAWVLRIRLGAWTSRGGRLGEPVVGGTPCPANERPVTTCVCVPCPPKPPNLTCHAPAAPAHARTRACTRTRTWKSFKWWLSFASTGPLLLLLLLLTLPSCWPSTWSCSCRTAAWYTSTTSAVRRGRRARLGIEALRQ